MELSSLKLRSLHYFEEPQIQILWLLAQTGSVDVLTSEEREGTSEEIPIAIPLPSAPPTHQTVDLCSGQAF